MKSWDINWVGPPALIHYRGRRSFHFFKLWSMNREKRWVFKKWYISNKFLRKYDNYFCPLLIYGIGSWDFCKNSSVPYTYNIYISQKPKNREPSELRSLRKDNHKSNPKSNQSKTCISGCRNRITHRTIKHDLYKSATAAPRPPRRR